MRVLPLCLVLFGGLFAACPAEEPLGTQCQVSANCADGQICVDGSCIADPGGPLPVGEGEGDGKEGEGDPGEGEGDTGEGEGDPGEGEGDPGEGEGDPGEGEGEGEGEGDPNPVCGAPFCGAHQTCTADDVCTNDAGSSVCDSVPSTTIDFFADQNAIQLDNVSGDRFVFDGQERFYIRRITNMLPGMVVDVQVSAPIDVVVYLMDDSGGQCVQQAKVDQQFTAAPEEFLLNVPTQDIDMIVTSFSSIPAGDSTGPVSIRTRGILCDTGNAAGDETDTQTAYDQCFRALSTTANTCDDNPCARDGNGQVTGKFCTLQSNVHTAGAQITLQNDVNTCCNSSVHTPPCP